MSVERPAPPRQDPDGLGLIAIARDADHARRRRLADAGAELARRPDHVLDDESRARATLLVAAAIGAAETALRAAEPMLDAAPHGDLPRRIADAGLLARSGLGAAALMRAEEHRLAAALIRVADPAAGDAPAGSGESVEAITLRLAEARRIDRTGDPLLPLHDLPAEERHALFWQVAACLADAALALQGEARAGNEDAMHRAAAAAVARTLAGIDEGEGIAAAAGRFAHALDAARALDDQVVASTLAAGRVPALAALLGVRARIGFDDARAMLGAPAAAAVLLRACGVGRDVAVAMLLTLALALDRGIGGDPTSEVAALADGFDLLAPDRARAAIHRTRLEPHYRDALAALAAEAGRG